MIAMTTDAAIYCAFLAPIGGLAMATEKIKMFRSSGDIQHLEAQVNGWLASMHRNPQRSAVEVKRSETAAVVGPTGNLLIIVSVWYREPST